jgi:hypothetical protein
MEIIIDDNIRENIMEHIEKYVFDYCRSLGMNKAETAKFMGCSEKKVWCLRNKYYPLDIEVTEEEIVEIKKRRQYRMCENRHRNNYLAQAIYLLKKKKIKERQLCSTMN